VTTIRTDTRRTRPSWPFRGPDRDLVAVAVVAGGVVAVMVLSTVFLPARASTPDLLAGRPWWEGWVYWDAGWYRHIALFGYSYTPGTQGPVAFFPFYPLLMRVGRWLVGSDIGPGVVVTIASGVGAAVLMARWLRDWLAPDAAWTALLLFLLYPFSMYLFGPVYADATFLLAALGSFTALERGYPWLAGLIGAVASATRPTGALVVVGLVVRTLERRGVIARSPSMLVGPPVRPADPTEDPAPDGRTGWRSRRGRLRPADPTEDPAPDGRTGWRSRRGRQRPADCGVLLAPLGVVAYACYLWRRFGDPLAFLTIQKAWGQTPGPSTWFKVEFFREMARFASPDAALVLVVHALVTVVALALLPRVVRRFGWGYGTYTILVVLLPALSTKSFTGMGRYLLAAFPCFAVAGELLADTGRLRTWTLAASAVALVGTASFFARGYYVS
jgi:hypothetical protein